MFGDKKNLMSRSSVFAALKSKGVAKVEVHYSGGNDEGGVNQIELFDADGKNIGHMDEYYGGTQQWDEATQKWIPAAAPNDDQRLSEALCAPVYDKYYSFAGDFYVDGIVRWDVATEKVKMSGTEQVSHDEDFDEDL